MHWGMMMTQPENFDLEALFEDARAQPPQMSQDLSERIAADALRHLPVVPLWRRLLDAIGGAAGLGGLVTATVAGVWIGVAPPADSLDPLVLFGAVESVDTFDATDLTGLMWSDFDLDSEEG